MPCGETLEYEIVRKRVKHICIRITKEKKVKVTAPLRADIRQVEEFVVSRQAWIFAKLGELEEKTVLHVDAYEWNLQKETYLTDIMARIFPRFVAYEIPCPKLRFRKMTGRYGSCQPGTGTITLNKILAEMPIECAEYVVAHELAHLVEANHSRAFYQVLGQVMPDYRQREEQLSRYTLHH